MVMDRVFQALRAIVAFILSYALWTQVLGDKVLGTPLAIISAFAANYFASKYLMDSRFKENFSVTYEVIVLILCTIVAVIWF